MKIAISSSGNTLESAVDPRFGRCAYFLVVDPANMRYEVFNNQGTAQSRGAGIQAAQFLVSNSVDVLISGQIRPHVVQTLTDAGIDIFAEQQGTIKDVVARYVSGGLKPAKHVFANSPFKMSGGAACGGGNRGRKASGDGRRMGHCRQGG